MRSLRFTPRPCFRCGNEDGNHFAACVPFMSFGSSTLRFYKLVARIVAKRSVAAGEIARAA